jgi:hypothetical protein
MLSIHDPCLGKSVHTLVTRRILVTYAHFMTILFDARIERLVLEPVVTGWQGHITPSISELGLQLEQIAPKNK